MTSMRSEPGSDDPAPLYGRLLGASWGELPEAVRRAHSDGGPKRLRGVLQVDVGPGRWAALWRSLLRLPNRSGPVPVTLEITPQGDTERWSRQIGDWRFVSRERAVGGELREIIGPLEITFRLRRDGEALRYRQIRARLRILGLPLPCPPFARPTVDALETQNTARTGTHLHVRLGLASTFLLAYHGDLEVES